MQEPSYLKKLHENYLHWCPGCGEMHSIPRDQRWQFNGDLDRPSFRPSLRVVRMKKEIVDGNWTGNVVRDDAGNIVPHCCHYTVAWGLMHFHPDSTHALAGQTVRLPELPTENAF